MNYTEEQLKDVQERVTKSNEAISKILKDNEMQLVPIPVYMPTPAGFTTGVEVKLVDTKYQPKEETKTADEVLN